MPRDVMNGVLDVPLGLYNTVRHPIESVTNIFGLFSAEGAGQFFTKVYNHPTRFATSVAASYGISSGIEGLSSNAVKVSSHARHNVFRINSQLPASSTSIVPKAAGGATGFLSGATKKIDVRCRGSEIDSELELPQLDASDFEELQLIIQTSTNQKDFYIRYCDWYEKLFQPKSSLYAGIK